MKHRADVVALDDGARGLGHAPGKHVAPARDDATESAPEDVLDQARWRRRHLGRTLLGVAAIGALALTVPEAVGYWHLQSPERLEGLMVRVTFAIGLWSILVSCPAQQVTLRGSVLGVHGPGLAETFDLADALQRVELSGRAGKRDWQLRFGRPDDRDLVLTRRDVDSKALDPVVRHHRRVAERRRHRAWARLGLPASC
jgi:hypothetical protein